MTDKKEDFWHIGISNKQWIFYFKYIPQYLGWGYTKQLFDSMRNSDTASPVFVFAKSGNSSQGR